MTLSLAQQSWQQIQQANKIAICFSNDNENLLTALALEYLLKQEQKSVNLFTNKNINHQKFKFLKYPILFETELNSSYYTDININLKNNKVKSFTYNIEKFNSEENILNIKIETSNDHLKTRSVNLGERSYNYDLVITINTPNLEMLDNLYTKNKKFFRNSAIINIDCDANNELYGDINWIKIQENSSLQQILSLYEEFAPQLLNEKSSSLMMTALITNNIKQISYQKDSKLIKKLSQAGANYHKINTELFYKHNNHYLKILGQALKNLEIQNNIAFTIIPKNLNIEENYLQEIIPHLINDVLKHIRNVSTFVISSEFETDWKHIFYNLGPEKQNWKKIMNNYHLLGMNKNQLVLSTPLDNIENLHKKFINLLK